ncbi:MAG TPA: hypothetical protein VHW02_06395 [Rhizomicrobium sp.]|nr:hypothetical protein [Rhizomicrobium sp.]
MAFKGGCGALFDQTPAMTLAPVAAVASGMWRRGLNPQSVWAGTLTDDDYPGAPLELEIYADGKGVLRTEYGWFPASNIAVAPDNLRFDLDGVREVAPSTVDADILRRAAAILSSDAVWNRADNRKCPDGVATWSIYCAMQKATIDVTGVFHHRRPALEVVRKIIDARTAARNYDHRLMDYNNDKTTKLADVQSLFAEALSDMNDPRWLAANDFAAPQEQP